MANQLSFSFEKSQPFTSLFFAILPPADVASRVSDIRKQFLCERDLSGSLIARGRLHISLHGVFRRAGFPNSLIETANEAGASVSMTPFEITFDRVMRFGRTPGRRAVVFRANSEGDARLKMLHRSLAQAMTKVGLGRCVRSGFTPHMTLFYDHRGVAERDVAPVRWIVRDFVLVESLTGFGRHVHLARFALQS